MSHYQGPYSQEYKKLVEQLLLDLLFHSMFFLFVLRTSDSAIYTESFTGS